MSVEELIQRLSESPAPPEAARQKPVNGGVPREPGLYAWWANLDAIGQLPLPTVSGCQLRPVYVGVAPARAGSVQTLRDRIARDLRGDLVTSPLRRTLCALLWQERDWKVGHSGARIILQREADTELNAWQAEHLQVSWASVNKPRMWRDMVAKTMSAPLNLAEDRNHPYGWMVSEARQRLRSAALGGLASVTPTEQGRA